MDVKQISGRNIWTGSIHIIDLILKTVWSKIDFIEEIAKGNAA